MNKPNVVVIAKDSSTQEEFKQILADEFEHFAALNGLDGVAISRMTKPSVVFVDMNSEQVHAFGVCQSLASVENVRTIPVFVIADTAEVHGELRALPNVKGIIQRPINGQQVKSKLQESLRKPASPVSAGQHKPKVHREEPIRVLSVDDSSVVRKLVTMILTAEGFKVTTATDGLDGINKAKELKPDIILLDFVMPKMNGFQVCRILQKDEQLSQIPVILVTSKGDKVGDKFVNQLGVTGYITKPFQPEELVSKIHQTLELRQPSKEAATEIERPQPAIPSSAPAQERTLSPAPTIKAQPTSAVSSNDLQAMIREEVSRAIEQKLQESVKAEVGKVLKNLEKLIEKQVIEKLNEYIRRMKKKD